MSEDNRPQGRGALAVYTVGHGTLTEEEFLKVLREHGIERVLDVREVPRSRHAPHFDIGRLSPFLRIRRIKYQHMKELGGLRRHSRPDSPNGGWRNAALRGFADYMLSSAFASALANLVHLAQGKRTAIMCSEATPWRCHRVLISDALVVRGIEVLHILPDGSIVPHSLSEMAVVDGTRITYPPGAGDPCRPE
ncbi:DUF488 domain-containing protein [Geomonas sp. RF6]|uniref:DUF488 domain-containing protein n=1 Tax=Geomonas sp. RF6 TaxID=2897342 RepID=UPI001E2D84DE|nr:DUF488 domain-containing protein [Geomonas sp. RF6]UFS70795.1 DUF488 domain-containing protein [Geomonas sp. RF6]